MFEERTFEAIRESILAELGISNTSRIEGSYTSDIISGCALEIARVYAYLNSLFNAMFPNENSGEYLHRRALDFGITPKPATAAGGSIQVRGTSSLTIPAGSKLVSSANGVAFKTNETINVSTSRITSVNVTAMQPGKIWVRANTLAFDPAISGAIVTHGDIRGGSEIESDEELYKRLQLRLREPPASGTAADYKRWALEVPGIGYAKVRLLNTGVILVTVATPELDRPSDQVLNAALAHINSKRPLGAITSVRWALESSCTISASIVLLGEATIGTVQELFSVAMAERIKEIAFDEETDSLTLARVTNILMTTPGVADVQEVLLNGRPANWEFGSTAMPVISDITITEAS